MTMENELEDKNEFVSLDLLNKEYDKMDWIGDASTCKVLAIRIFPQTKKEPCLGSWNCSRERGEHPIISVRLKRRKETKKLEVDVVFPLGIKRYPRFEDFSKNEGLGKSKLWNVWGQIPLSISQAKKLAKALLEQATKLENSQELP